MLCLQVGLRMEAISFCIVLEFSIPALSFRKTSCAYYSVLYPVNGVLHQVILSMIGVVLLKAEPLPCGMMLRCVKSEFLSYKDLHSIMVTLGPMLQLVMMKAKT